MTIIAWLGAFECPDQAKKWGEAEIKGCVGELVHKANVLIFRSNIQCYKYAIL